MKMGTDWPLMAMMRQLRSESRQNLRLRFVLSQPSREEAAGRLGHPTHLWLEAGRGKAKKVRSSSALVLLRRLQPTAGSGVCNLLLLLSHVNCNVGKKRSTQIALPRIRQHAQNRRSLGCLRRNLQRSRKEI